MNNEYETSIDFEREEILSKNLDFTISNGFLDQMPLPIINRILNSLTRKLKDHHLLFKFIIKTIEKYSTNEIKNRMTNEEREIFH